MRTISKQDLIKRGLKKGDIYFSKNHKSSEFTGWYIVVDSRRSVGLDIKVYGAWGDAVVDKTGSEIKYIVLTEDIEKMTFINKLSSFLKNFNISEIEYCVTSVDCTPIVQYIKGVHFGNTKQYTWRVLEECKDRFDLHVGDTVSVFTTKGEQLVEIQEIYEDELIESHKIVNRIVQRKIRF